MAGAVGAFGVGAEQAEARAIPAADSCEVIEGDEAMVYPGHIGWHVQDETER